MFTFRRAEFKNGILFCTIRSCNECPFKDTTWTRYKIINDAGDVTDDDYEPDYRESCNLNNKIRNVSYGKIHPDCPIKETIFAIATKPLDSYDIKELLKKSD